MAFKKNPKYDQKLKYKKVIELTLILALLFCVVLFQAFKKIEHKKSETKIAVTWKINETIENIIVPLIRCRTGTSHVVRSEKIFFQGAFFNRLPFVINTE